MFSKLLKFFNDNHGETIAVTGILVLFFWLYGCESKVSSILNPELKVTRAEFQNEVDNYYSRALTKFQDLDNQDEVKRLILEKAALFATTGTFNPTGLLNLVVSIAAVGSALDSRRKVKALTKPPIIESPPGG